MNYADQLQTAPCHVDAIMMLTTATVLADCMRISFMHAHFTHATLIQAAPADELTRTELHAKHEKRGIRPQILCNALPLTCSQGSKCFLHMHRKL